MNIKKFILAIIIVGVMIALAQKVTSAVVATDLSATEYNQKLSVSTVAVKGELMTGYTSTTTAEMTLTTDTMITSNHTWSTPEQVGFIYDAAGNSTLRAGSNTLVDQNLLPLNAFLLQLKDSAPGSFPTELRDITVNGVSIRNLFAKDSVDQVMITGFGSTLDINASFYRNPFSAGNESLITFTGINIPEPSIFLTLIPGCLLLFRRRRI